MNLLRIHALEAHNVVTKAGLEKLLRILSPEEQSVLVISSLGNEALDVTDLLVLAKARDERLWSMAEARLSSWENMVESVLDVSNSVVATIKEGFDNIEDLLRSVWLVGEVSDDVYFYVKKLSASWVAMIVHSFLQSVGIKSEYLEYSSVGKRVTHTVTVVYCEEGEKRSEYAAALLASRLGANGVTFWNSTSLLKSADDGDVPSALVIRALSYAEATELSYYGSPIIHPQSLLPAIEAEIEVTLRCWNAEDDPGTVVSKEGNPNSPYKVKGFSTIRNVALVNVEGVGMSGVVGISARLFSAIRKANVSVILISQGSSEYSICFAVYQDKMEEAVRVARLEFKEELENKKIHSIEGHGNLAILAAVGQKMSGQRGIAGNFFSSLGRAGVNVVAIAQGSSETNISAVILQQDVRRALRALHARFFLSRQTLSVGLLGPGSIGSELLSQIDAQLVRLREQFGLAIHIRGIANSKKMLLDDEGIDPGNWRDRFEKSNVDLDLTAFAAHISATYFPHSLIIDCSTSSELAGHYAGWLKNRIHVITPNKKAGTAEYSYYKELMDACLSTGSRFLYETTVGAGLPVIWTLKDLVQTGDHVHRIEGMLSGTLAWLFSTYDGSVPFSTLVRQAKEMGYTEPDPRDDLSGMDVGRKTVILARELGGKIEVADVPIQSLVPESLEGIGLDEFMERLEEIDPIIEQAYRTARSKGEFLRYVGTVDEEGNCEARLGSFGPDHPFSQATGTDNVILFVTDRYRTQPLVIKGPGAGREVTAGGVFSDILRLSSYLGARI